MTNSKRIPVWHWLLLFLGTPLAGAVLSFVFLTQEIEHPFVTASFVAGLAAALLDFARRRDGSAALAGIVAGGLVVPVAYGLFFSFLVVMCSTQGCSFE